MSSHAFATGKGAGGRQSHHPPAPASGGKLQVKNTRPQLPHYPFQPLPKPNGAAPYRFDLSDLLTAGDVTNIKNAGTMVCHTVGDTGDYRGQQQDFVADMMTQDAGQLGSDRKPPFLYHLGDVVYFAGDIDKYGDNFYETYKNYPPFIVAIPGNHDCQPDDPQDGPVDPDKKPLDGFVQNFMAPKPNQLGSLKSSQSRTQMDLPNVYWTFTTPFATFVGLFSNVGETEGEFHQDQLDWFQSEVKAADPELALIVAVHHPPFSGDEDHAGSTVVHTALFKAFAAAKRYPNLILSGHVHNYQRFTNTVTGAKGAEFDIACVVAGAGGYTKLGKMQKIDGQYPTAPLTIESGLMLEQYDHDNFGFMRLELSKTQILGTYFSAPYNKGAAPATNVVDRFSCDLVKNTVTTL